MWQPDSHYKNLRAALDTMSNELTKSCNSLMENPTAVDNRARAIRLLRNIDYALQGLNLDLEARSAVEVAANLADTWTASFDAVTAPLTEAIAALNVRVTSLAQFESSYADLEAEECRLRTRRKELEHLQELVINLPEIIKECEELERQTKVLEKEQTPMLVRFEAAMTAMAGLLERVGKSLDARNEQEFMQLLDDRRQWLETQHASEAEQADLRYEISRLTAQSDEVRAKIIEEQNTFNAVRDEHSGLVSDLNTHLAINKELNDALRRFGVEGGVGELDIIIDRLKVDLERLDAGVNQVLRHRQEALDASVPGHDHEP